MSVTCSQVLFINMSMTRLGLGLPIRKDVLKSGKRYQILDCILGLSFSMMLKWKTNSF